MSKAKRSNPHSKVRGRPDGRTLSAAIPMEIVHAMHIQPGDSLEWIWITKGLESYCQVVRKPNMSHSEMV
jgi:hypothetical protein